jgi:hypothetical protein
MGDNVLALTIALADDKRLGDTETNSKAPEVLFYDILGLFTLVMSKSTCRALCLLVVGGFWYLLHSGKFDVAPGPGSPGLASHPLRALSGHAITVAMTVLAPAAVGMLLPAVGLRMVWYARPELLWGLFGVPALIALFGTTILTADRTVPPHQAEHNALLCRVACWSVVTLLAGLAGLGFGFIGMVWVVFPVAAKLCATGGGGGGSSSGGGAGGGHGPSATGLRLAVRLVVGDGIPALLTVSCLVWTVFAMFVPLMGRAGFGTPTDVIIGAIVGLMTAMLGSTASSLAIVVHGRDGKLTRRLQWLALAIFAWAVCSAAANPAPFSANPPHVKRLYIQHAVRLVHGVAGETHHDSGLWVNVSLSARAPPSTLALLASVCFECPSFPDPINLTTFGRVNPISLESSPSGRNGRLRPKVERPPLVHP